MSGFPFLGTAAFLSTKSYFFWPLSSQRSLTFFSIPLAPTQTDPTKKLETPCNVELVNTTRYQLRAYGLPAGQSFSTASVQASSWGAATQKGFGSNFAYISGANKQGVKIPMTAPVVTRNPGGDEANWLVSFFTPQSIYPTGGAA